MSSYEALAGYYDELTEDVVYNKRADFIEKLMGRSRIPVRTVLDLACGTGSLTLELYKRGVDIYGIDGITIEGLVWSNGGDWFNEDRTQLTLAGNTALQEGYEMFRSLYTLKIAPDADSGAGSVPSMRANLTAVSNTCVCVYDTARIYLSW